MRKAGGGGGRGVEQAESRIEEKQERVAVADDDDDDDDPPSYRRAGGDKANGTEEGREERTRPAVGGDEEKESRIKRGGDPEGAVHELSRERGNAPTLPRLGASLPLRSFARSLSSASSLKFARRHDTHARKVASSHRSSPSRDRCYYERGLPPVERRIYPLPPPLSPFFVVVQLVLSVVNRPVRRLPRRRSSVTLGSAQFAA